MRRDWHTPSSSPETPTSSSSDRDLKRTRRGPEGGDEAEMPQASQPLEAKAMPAKAPPLKSDALTYPLPIVPDGALINSKVNKSRLWDVFKSYYGETIMIGINLDTMTPVVLEEKAMEAAMEADPLKILFLKTLLHHHHW